VEKLSLIAPLCQASYFPVFDWLSTSLKYLNHSANILSVATQVDLSFRCGAAVGLFLPSSMACAFGLPALDGNGCGQPLYILIGASRKYAGGSHEHRDCSRRTHAPSRPISLRPFASRVRWCCPGCSCSLRCTVANIGPTAALNLIEMLRLCHCAGQWRKAPVGVCVDFFSRRNKLGRSTN